MYTGEKHYSQRECILLTRGRGKGDGYSHPRKVLALSEYGSLCECVSAGRAGSWGGGGGG
jgi:hypothetical protein